MTYKQFINELKHTNKICYCNNYYQPIDFYTTADPYLNKIMKYCSLKFLHELNHVNNEPNFLTPQSCPDIDISCRALYKAYLSNAMTIL